DILATAKSIGAGLPISAIVAREEIMESILPGTIGGTYCGNPLACAAAIKTIEIMERDNLAKRSLEIGEKVQAVYKEWMDKYEVIGDVRGLGGMIGIEFVTDKESKTPNGEIVSKIVKNAVEKGLM
ncbi:4-aminobutyrate aminotransferase, partial [human gut metagenome]